MIHSPPEAQLRQRATPGRPIQFLQIQEVGKEDAVLANKGPNHRWKETHLPNGLYMESLGLEGFPSLGSMSLENFLEF